MEGRKKLSIWQKLLIAAAGIVLFILLALAVIILKPIVKVAVNSPKVEERTTTVYDNIVGWDRGEDDFVETDLTPVGIKLSEQALDGFENYLAAYHVDYDYGETYNIPKAIEYMNTHSVNSATHKHDVRVNGELNADALYGLVKTNNDRFMNDKDNMSKGWYKEYSDENLSTYCGLIVEMLENIHNKYPQFNMDELCCYLYDLKILNRTGSLDFAAVEIEKKILHINEETIEGWADLTKNERMHEGVLNHEMMHLFQVACSCNEADGELRAGISRDYEGLDINPLTTYWLLEAAAEMSSSEFLGKKCEMYLYSIGYAETLNFILNLGNTDKAARVQDLCFDRNADIYKLFDMTTASEKEEFIKMMYSIEILQESPHGFYDWYEDRYNVDFNTDEQEKIRLHLCVKEDALLTLTKMFYRNLARKVNSGNASLQDIYYLMRIYECDLQNHMSNNEVSFMVYFKDLYPKYLEIRDEFFKTLTAENNITADELNDKFANYSMNAKSGDTKLSPNCTLAFLSNEQRQAVINYCGSIYKKGYPNMTKAYEICLQWLEKAPYENIVFDS